MTIIATQASAYASTVSPARIAERIRAAGSVLVTAHDKPDGDAVGSVLAVTRALRSLGKRVQPWLCGPFDPSLGVLLAGEKPGRAPESMPADDFDLVIVVDTGSWSQLEILGPWMKARLDRCINIDHHRSGDTGFADRIVDTSCASCTSTQGSPSVASAW